jgi:hypothetical protein
LNAMAKSGELFDANWATKGRVKIV